MTDESALPGPEELSSGEQDAAQREYERDHPNELCSGCNKPEPRHWCWNQSPTCPFGRPPRWPDQTPPTASQRRRTHEMSSTDGQSRHPGVQHLLDLLVPNPNLTGTMSEVAAYVNDLALTLAVYLDDGPELSAGLRKLLEAKDCFVRQAVIDSRTAEQ